MATSRSRSQPPPPERGRRVAASIRGAAQASTTSASSASAPARPARRWFAHVPPARSPLFALLALLGIGVLVVGAAAGRPALAAAVLVVQLILGLCWLTLLQATLATGVLVGLAALACDTLLLRDDSADAGSVAGVVGTAVFVAIAAQLLRRQRRDVTAGLSAALSGVVLVAAAALLLPLRQFASGQQVILTALVAVAVALVVARLVPGPALLIRAAGLAVAVVVGGRFGDASQELSAATATATAAAAAALALVVDLGVLRVGADVAPRQRTALRPVAALLPVVAAVPAAYVVGWIVGG